MKSLIKYLTLVPFLFFGRDNSKVLDIDFGQGKIYDVSYNKGIYQISKLCEEAKLEDSWFYNGKFWINVGFNESKANTYIDLKLVRNSMNKFLKKKLIHNHPLKFKTGNFYFSPPSKEDLKNISDFSSYIKKGDIGNVDTYGLWNYHLYNEFDFSKKDSILHKYNIKLNKFMNKQNSKDFNHKKEIKNFIEDSKKLGIYLKYKKIR